MAAPAAIDVPPFSAAYLTVSRLHLNRYGQFGHLYAQIDMTSLRNVDRLTIHIPFFNIPRENRNTVVSTVITANDDIAIGFNLIINPNQCLLVTV